MSCAPIYQIETTGLLPKHSGRMATTRLSLLPAFMQQAQPASSAVVLSYMLLGKDHRGRGSQTIKTELNLFGFSVNQCDLPVCGSPEVSVEPLIVKPQLERLECRGLVTNPQMTHLSLHLIIQAMTWVNKLSPWHTQLLIKNIPQNSRKRRHYTQNRKGIPSQYSRYKVTSFQFPIRHRLLLTSQNVFWVNLRGNVWDGHASYYKCCDD